MEENLDHSYCYYPKQPTVNTFDLMPATFVYVMHTHTYLYIFYKMGIMLKYSSFRPFM